MANATLLLIKITQFISLGFGSILYQQILMNIKNGLLLQFESKLRIERFLTQDVAIAKNLKIQDQFIDVYLIRSE